MFLIEFLPKTGKHADHIRKTIFVLCMNVEKKKVICLVLSITRTLHAKQFVNCQKKKKLYHHLSQTRSCLS